MDKIEALQKKIDDLKRKAATFQDEIAIGAAKVDALREKISGDLLADRDTAKDEAELNRLTNHQSVLSGAVVRAAEQVKALQDDIFQLKVEADMEKIRALDLAGEELVKQAAGHVRSLQAIGLEAERGYLEMRALKNGGPEAAKIWQNSRGIKLLAGLTPLPMIVKDLQAIAPELMPKGQN